MSTTEQIGQEFIEHYGVKGMRWGVRRSDKQLERARKRREKIEEKQEKKARRKLGDKEYERRVAEEKRILKDQEDFINAELERDRRLAADAEKASQAFMKAQTKGLDSLSNDELKLVTERMQLEANFNRLNAPNPAPKEKSKMDAGKAYAGKVGGQMFNQVVLGAVAQIGKQIVAEMLKDAAMDAGYLRDTRKK